MPSFKKRRTAYTMGSPLTDLAPDPIVSSRAPKTTDRGEKIGQLFIDKTTGIYYVLTNIIAGESQWTTTDINSSTGDVTISTAGTVSIASSDDTIGAIALSTSGGTSESIVISSTAGTSASSVDISSTDGGVTITSGLASADAINLVATSGGVDIDGALEVNITSSEASVSDAVTISASAADSGIVLDTGATPGVTFTNGTQSFQFLVGTGSPDTAVTASQGSLYVDVAGTSGTTVLYTNTSGGTAWSPVGV